MAALGYRNASVRFPLASRNVCPNNGIETRGKFHFGGAKGLLAQLTLHCHLAAGLAPSPHYYHHSFPMQGRNGGPVRIVAISHLLERKHTVQSNRRQSSPPHGTRRHQCESKCMPRRKLLFLIRNLGMIRHDLFQEKMRFYPNTKGWCSAHLCRQRTAHVGPASTCNKADALI